ncbi:MAG: protein-glutamate O-methyltransferase [Deferrisomatales bacterium]
MARQLDAQTFEILRELIYRHSGIRVTPKEAGPVAVRVGRRATALGFASPGEYARFVASPQGAAEVPALLDAVTVNYTFFFREPAQFRTLRARVFPQLLAARKRRGSRALRVWSAGCSSGEEPYSIAVSFAEAVGDPHRYDFRVLATDINRSVLKAARRAVYPVERLERFPQELFYKYWCRDEETPEGHLRLVEEVRRMAVFRRHNILREMESLRGELDLVFCRHVMIYFDRPARVRLVGSFARYLAPGGYLFLGESEELEDPDRRFRAAGKGVYRKPW